MAWLGALSLLAWLYLVFAHGRFWLCDQRLDGREPAPPRWPTVAAVVPARDEADVLPRVLRSLLEQDYPGELRIYLVDDESADGTGDVAAKLAKTHPQGIRLTVLRTPPRPPGWVGKMWALASGVAAAREAAPAPDLWWLTDADVVHAEDTLRRLAAKAEHGGADLVSLMVKLESGTGLDVLLVPAFVYYFQKLYPFPRVNEPRSRTAGAAGGCVLLRDAALVRIGGIEALRGEVIDDCALGAAVKRTGGRLWLGIATAERSIRGYAGISGVWNMVARSAFTQLGHSSVLLAGTLAGLALLYLLPPLGVLALPWHRDPALAAASAGAWMLQAASFAPTLALYGRGLAFGLLLPVAGTLYAGMTLDSALRHWRRRGAEWKGRVGAGRAG
jgi:hopene-associated glycosyltransferase HpnB